MTDSEEDGEGRSGGPGAAQGPGGPVGTSAPSRPAWERRTLPLVARLAGSLGEGVRPFASVGTVLEGPVRPALTFALLTALLPSALSGVIPFTQTLLFKFAGAVEFKPGSSSEELALDVLTGMLAGVVFVAALWLAYALPLASLVGAFTSEQNPPGGAASPVRAAWRLVLYRAWVVPVGMLAFNVTLWLWPSQPELGTIGVLFMLMRVAPLLIWLFHAQAFARAVSSSLLGGLAISLVPIMLVLAVGELLAEALQQILPQLIDWQPVEGDPPGGIE